jgi:hypothetical protein
MQIEVKKILDKHNNKIRDWRWEIYMDGVLLETTDFDPTAFVQQLEEDIKNGKMI